MARRKKSSLPPAFLANIQKMKAGKIGKGSRKKAATSKAKPSASGRKKSPAGKRTTTRKTASRRKK